MIRIVPPVGPSAPYHKENPMLSVQNPFLFILAGSLLAPALSAPISITGRLVDESINPIGGGRVVVMASRLATVTGNDGRFIVTDDDPALPFSSGRVPGRLSRMVKGRLVLTIPLDATPVRVETFAANGARVFTAIEAVLAHGEYSLDPLPGPPASGAYVVRAAVGREIVAYRLMRAQGSAPASAAARTATALGKSAAVAAVLDSLEITASGYTTARVMVETMAGDIGDIVLSTTGGYSRVWLTNGTLTIMAYEPDATAGYYRSCRFDWAGIVAKAKIPGHTFFTEWKTPHDPMDTEGILGPAEEFGMDLPLGYNEVGSGGTFLKIGVGVLQRNSSSYFFGNNYTIADPGAWQITRGNRWIEFRHDVPTVRSWDYSYTKRLTLNNDTLIIAHTFTNTGTAAIATQVYSHNFIIIDDIDIGSGYAATLGFPPTVQPGASNMTTYTSIQGNVISMTRTLIGATSIWAVLTGYGSSASQNTATVRNATAAASVTFIGDLPLVKYQIWGTQHALSPEPFVDLSVAAGASKSWTNRLVFKTD